MKKDSILYILYDENLFKNSPDRDTLRVANEDFSVSVIKINPFIFHGFCGQRYKTVYVDSKFMDSPSGRNLIDTVFKPMACLGKDAMMFLI